MSFDGGRGGGIIVEFKVVVERTRIAVSRITSLPFKDSPVGESKPFDFGGFGSLNAVLERWRNDLQWFFCEFQPLLRR